MFFNETYHTSVSREAQRPTVFNENCCDECDTYFPSINYDEFDTVSRKRFVGFKQLILKRK